MSGARGNIRSGVQLSFLNTLLGGVLQFVIMIALARLLTIVEYGTFAFCVAINSLSAVFVTNVIERVLVVTDEKDGPRDETLTILLLCLMAGSAAMAVCAALNFWGLSHVDLGVLAALSGVSLVNAAVIVPRVTLRRQIRYGPIVIAETTGLIIGQGVTAIAMAMAGWGPYALVGGAAVQAIIILAILRIRVALRLGAPSLRTVGEMVRSASGLGVNAAVEIANGQVAPLALGMRLGAVSLGLFNRSYSLVQMPIQLLVSSMSRVMISALFAVSGDRDRLRSMTRSLIRITAVMATPVAAGIAGASENFVLVAFGEKWLPAAEIMPWLAISAWATMIGTVFGIVAEASREFAGKARVQLVSTAILIVSTLGGSFAGLLGAIMGIALSSCVFLLLFATLAGRLLDISLPAVVRWLVPGLVTGVPCFFACFAIGHLLAASAIVVFLAQVASCAAVASVLLLLAYPQIALQVIEGIAPGVLARTPAMARHLRRAAAGRGA